MCFCYLFDSDMNRQANEVDTTADTQEFVASYSEVSRTLRMYSSRQELENLESC
jgi:hypothetical protein